MSLEQAGLELRRIFLRETFAFACGRSVTDRQLSIFNYLCVCIICTNIISLCCTVPFYAAQPCFYAAQPFFLAEQPCFFAAQSCFLAAQAHIHAAESHLLAAQPHFHAAEVALTDHRTTETTNSVLARYDGEGVVCPSKLRRDLFTTSAADNLDHNPSSTSSHGSFYGTAISVVQHPSTEQL